MKIEDAAVHILSSLIVSNALPDYNKDAHINGLVDEAIDIADRLTKKLIEHAKPALPATPAIPVTAAVPPKKV